MEAPPNRLRAKPILVWVFVILVILTLLTIIGGFGFYVSTVVANMMPGKLEEDLAKAKKNGLPMNVDFLDKPVKYDETKPIGTSRLFGQSRMLSGYDVVTSEESPFIDKDTYSPKAGIEWLKEWPADAAVRRAAETPQIDLIDRPQHGWLTEQSDFISIGRVATYLGDAAVVESGQGYDDLALADLKRAKHVIQLLSVQNTPVRQYDSAELWSMELLRLEAVAEIWNWRGRDLAPLEDLLDDSWLDRDMTTFVKKFFIYGAYHQLGWTNCYEKLDEIKNLTTAQRRSLDMHVKFWNEVCSTHSLEKKPIEFANAISNPLRNSVQPLGPSTLSVLEDEPDDDLVGPEANAISEFLVSSKLAHAAMAVMKYHSAHQKYPATLAEIGASFIDPASGKAIRYKVTGDHAKFWFVGRNGIDEGGLTAAEQKSAHEDSDDSYLVLPLVTIDSTLAEHSLPTPPGSEPEPDSSAPAGDKISATR